MSFNLLTAPFLPVRTREGGTRVLAIIDLPKAEDALEPDWPRPDFNAATMELLIGIAALAMQPQNSDAWADVWEEGPDGWADRLAGLAPAFELLGDGPRFLQEYGGMKGDVKPIEALLIDTPGDNGQKKNADLLTHRARYPQLGLPAAAMALYTLQAYAPAGGAGNQTSMRGGGPLTTLVIPQGETPLALWRKVWANVPHVASPVDDLAQVCPWMRPGISAGKISQSHECFHDLHSLFGMPRRLWLIETEGRCTMTNVDGQVVSGFLQRPHGLDYGIWAHPLTPYRRQKEGSEPYTAKPSSTRFRAADWIAAALGNPPLRERARTVTQAQQRIKYLKDGPNAPSPRLRVSGWNMNNMEATDWLAVDEPLYMTGDPEMDERMDRLARILAAAADEAAGLAAQAVKRALFGEAKTDTDKGVISAVRVTALDAGDDGYHDWMGRALEGESPDALRWSWRDHLRWSALEIFDQAAPVPVDDPEKAKRVLMARRNLLADFGNKTKAKALKELVV